MNLEDCEPRTIASTSQVYSFITRYLNLNFTKIRNYTVIYKTINLFLFRVTSDLLVKLEVKAFLGKSENPDQKGPKETEVEEVLRVTGEIWEHQDTRET
jgi:hypothetical protein